ncbi:MAG: tetratricopeptide repeat protein [Gemmatimonadota bacterium]|nr:MAG: tetratricopeptide repeat protein [Gemmatimonadota bacterium]
MRNTCIALATVWAALCGGTTLAAQQPQLGSIAFPTSASGEAQQRFVEGVLWLHSFEYESAAKAFRKAQELDPDFAMAYWGESMTRNHSLWQERDRDAAVAALERLGSTPAERRAKAPTEREKLFLDAVEALWAEGPKAERDTAYYLAMGDLLAAYPDDPEAQAFYALSILGLSQAVRVFPSYMRAAAIADELLRQNPDHPGAAHYLIHSVDDPIHAPLGLRAARAYSKIAPDAAHAQHMTTHIFVALGMWDDVVSQNTVAAELTGWWPGHYTSWLGYGLQQQGRFEEARAHLERARRNIGERPGVGRRAYLASMRAHYLVDTRRWSDAGVEWEIDLSDAGTVVRAMDAFALGYAALERGDADAAERHVSALGAMTTQAEGGWYGGNDTVPLILRNELQAMLYMQGGSTDEALDLMRETTAMEDALPMEYGPPDVVKPSHELLGEMLLALGRYDEAQQEFQRALALAPKRALSLAGLQQAAAAAGDEKTATRARGMLAEVWHAADPELMSGTR